MNILETTVYDDGDLIYPTLMLTDDDGNPIDADEVAFWFRPEGGDSADYSAYIVRLAQGSYRVDSIDSTGYGGRWLFGQWLTTGPQSSEPWQCFVQKRVA